MARIVIILTPGSTSEQNESMAERLAELGKAASSSYEFVLIEAPSSRLERDEICAILKPRGDDRVRLSFVTASSDQPSDLIEATNEALRLAVQAKLDAIVAGPRVTLDGEAIQELRAVGEQDPMIGFVEPFVTDEGDPSLPNQHRSRSLPSAQRSERVFEDVPRLSYVPILEEPIVLIRSRMLQEFDLLDPVFKDVASALNDFALRANRCAYRVVRANHACVTARGRKADERVADADDEQILGARFPYLRKEVARYEASPDQRTRKLLAGLRPQADGRLNIIFACNNLGNIHNGTSELAKRVITEFSLNHSNEYNMHILCSRNAFDFHQYRNLAGVTHLSGISEADEGRFFASIRLVQPFGDEDIALLASQAPVTMVLILDTIAIDCMQIDPRLARVWERMLKSTSALGFISDFSRLQFERRFSQGGEHLAFTALCSTDTKEYGANEVSGTPRDDGYVLLVGNPYEHKFLKASCDLFRREVPGMKLVVLGLKMEDDDQVSSYQSGQLSDEATADLYARASLLLFPSHCEGFGLPVMHGLAHGKPVVARDLPVFREIRERVREARNLHLFGTTIEMVRFAATKPVWDATEVGPPRRVQNWADMAKAMRDALSEARQRVTYRGLHDRLLEAEACREIASREALAAQLDARAVQLEARAGEFEARAVELEARAMKQARELAEIKLRSEPPVKEGDLPAQAAHFAAKRLEARILRFLEHKWSYSVTRSVWGAVKWLRNSRPPGGDQ